MLSWKMLGLPNPSRTFIIPLFPCTTDASAERILFLPMMPYVNSLAGSSVMHILPAAHFCPPDRDASVSPVFG
jgi:hypothetical protein